MKPAKHQDLHGNVPNASGTVLILVDVLNDLEFDAGEQLLGFALPMAERLQALKRRAKAAGVPVIYANDNFGKWQSDIRTVVEHCLRDRVRGAPLVERLWPDDDDYCVLKPKHSAFYGSPLDILLAYLEAETLVIGGLTSDNCVLFTAMDAYLRDYRLCIPEDGSAAATAERHAQAIAQMRGLLKADTTPSPELVLATGGAPSERRS